MKVKEESEKVGLKLNIQKTKIWSHHFMANRWGNNGNSIRLIFLGSKITADGDCSHEIKRRLLLGGKVMTNLDSILKSRDITLPTDVHLVKAMGFPVVVYGCESWTVKKAESRRIDAFELWYWRRLLRVPWTAKRFYNITSYSLLGGTWCICSIAEVNKGYLCNQAFVGCPWKKLLGKMGIDNLKYSLSYSSPS